MSDSGPLPRWKSRLGDLGFGTAVFIGSLALMLLRFRVPQPIGIADNADGRRVLCHLGVTLDWPIRDYVKFHYPPGPGCEYNYVSSQLWIDRAAQKLGSVLFGHAGFSLIDLAMVCCVVASLALALIAVALPLSRLAQLIVAALVWLVVADSAFFGYFASVFTEGTAFLGILALIAGLLLLPKRGWLTALGAVLVLGGGIVGLNAKTQALVIIVPLAIALLVLWPRSRHRLVNYVVPVLLVTVLGGATSAIQGSIDGKPSNEAVGGTEFLREINVYNAIFQGIADGHHDTKGDLADLGFPESFAQYAGKHWWDESTARMDPAYPRYRDKITLSNVAKYYVTHPVRTTQLLHLHAKHLLTARVEYLGSYGPDSGQPPRAHEHRVPIFSTATQWIAPLGLFAVLPLWILLGWLGVRSIRGRDGRELGVVVLFLVGAAVPQFGVAALADGHEGVKHQTITLFCTLLAVPLAVASLLRQAQGAGDIQHVDVAGLAC